MPIIREAQHMTVARLAIAIAASADDVRGGQVTPDTLTGGTFTITNSGSRGALFDTPILNTPQFLDTPQSGILGTGTVVEMCCSTAC